MELRKLCEHKESLWKIEFGDREAQFSSGDISLYICLIDGKFPDYRMILSDLKHQRSLSISRQSLLNVFRRVSIFISKNNTSVNFELGGDTLILKTINPEYGEFREELSVDYDGDPIKIAFNLRYFQDILSAVESDILNIELGETLDPCIIQVPDRNDCKFIVMPMRLNG